jgi:hypothetical protein
LTSQQIAELVRSINRTFDTQASDATILEHSTVRSIAAWLQDTAGTSAKTLHHPRASKD